MVNQISIFAENKKGAVRAITQILSEADINIQSFVTNDSAEFGIIRMLVSDAEKAGALLSDAGYQIKQTPVMAVEIPAIRSSLSTRTTWTNLRRFCLPAAVDANKSSILTAVYATNCKCIVF